MVTFEYEKTFGLVCDENKFCLATKGTESFLYCSNEDIFVIYELKKLNQVFVSKPVGGKICFIASCKNYVIIALSNKIKCFSRMEELWCSDFTGEIVSDINSIAGVILVLDIKGILQVFDAETGHVDRNIDTAMHFGSIFHPMNYLNKIIVYGKRGVELWNFNSETKIHQFTIPEDHQVSCFAQSPVIDIVALGFENGLIQIFDLRKAIVLYQLEHSSKALITSISFCTDDKISSSHGIMSSSTSDGDVVFWDLVERCKISVLRKCHTGVISRAVFLPKEPLLVSSGRDNSIKIHIFEDRNPALPRLLKFRSGHSLPSKRIRFYGKGIVDEYDDMNGDRSKKVLSISDDLSFRMSDLFFTQQNFEFSQKIRVKSQKSRGYKETFDVKLTEILDFDFVETRENQWSNVISVHKNHCAAYLWSSPRKNLASIVLRPDQSGLSGSSVEASLDDNASVLERFGQPTCCILSFDGNFSFIGSSKGFVFKYNVQSGRLIASFPTHLFFELTEGVKKKARQPLEPSSALRIITTGLPEDAYVPDFKERFTTKIDKSKYQSGVLHHSEICGVCVDIFLTKIISCGINGDLRAWDFHSTKLLWTLELEDDVTKFCYSKDTNLFALVLNNITVQLYHFSTYEKLRQIEFTSKINDLCFGENGEVVYTGHDNGEVNRTDVMYGRQNVCAELVRPCRSINVSRNNDFLITTDFLSKGMRLWKNKNLNVSISLLNTQPENMKITEPPLSLDIISNETMLKLEQRAKECEQYIDFVKSGTEKWLKLSQIDDFRSNNSPIVHSIEEKKAPFFLPNVNDVSNNSASTGATLTNQKSTKQSKILNSTNANQISPFLESLYNSAEKFTEHIFNFSPSELDFELQQLCFDSEDKSGVRHIKHLLEWCGNCFTKFEAVYAILARILHHHQDVIYNNEMLRNSLIACFDNHDKRRTELLENLQKSIHLCKFLTHQS